jgi:hypothetical protein
LIIQVLLIILLIVGLCNTKIIKELFHSCITKIPDCCIALSARQLCKATKLCCDLYVKRYYYDESEENVSDRCKMFHYCGCTKGIKIKAIFEYLDECKLNCSLIDHITTARINSSTKSGKRKSNWTKISLTISSSSSSIKELTILTTTTALTTTLKSNMKTVETFIEKTQNT